MSQLPLQQQQHTFVAQFQKYKLIRCLHQKRQNFDRRHHNNLKLKLNTEIKHYFLNPILTQFSL